MTPSNDFERCPKCGHPLGPPARHCPNCGHAIGLVEGLKSDWKRPFTKFEAILFLIVAGVPVAFMGGCGLMVALGPHVQSGIDFNALGLVFAAVFIPLFVLILYTVVKAIRRKS
jgi:hypothetical protein